MASNNGVKKVVLLACGSFNPITNMHLRMFELARDALQKTGLFSVIEGIISPVHDDYNKLTTKKLAPGNHRVQMTKLATRTSDWVSVDEWEAKQNKWLETVNILKHTKEMITAKYLALENDNVPRVKLLCGGDFLESFAVPGLWKEDDIASIVRDYGIVVLTRHGSDPEKFINESNLLLSYKNNIFIVTTHIYNDISSTKVRHALRHNESIKYIVPDPVIKYIREHDLYQERAQNVQITSNQQENVDCKGLTGTTTMQEEQPVHLGCIYTGKFLLLLHAIK